MTVRVEPLLIAWFVAACSCPEPDYIERECEESHRSLVLRVGHDASEAEIQDYIGRVDGERACETYTWEPDAPETCVIIRIPETQCCRRAINTLLSVDAELQQQGSHAAVIVPTLTSHVVVQIRFGSAEMTRCRRKSAWTT